MEEFSFISCTNSKVTPFFNQLFESIITLLRKGFFVSKMLVNSIQHEDPEYFNKTLTPGETITIEKLGETLENIADIKIEGTRFI